MLQDIRGNEPVDSTNHTTAEEPVPSVGDPYHIPPPLAALAEAVRDYRLLLDRGYPVSASLKLVGDRHRLDKKDRNILFRGVLDQANSAAIAARLVSKPAAGFSLAVDVYNVLFTLINYRRGHPVFISTDGLVRDAGGSYGCISHSVDFDDALKILAPILASLHPASVTLYLDSPVSGSGNHAAAIREALSELALPCQVTLVPSADPSLIAFDGSLVATSDSVIASRAKAPVYDLARAILQWRYRAQLTDIGSFL